DLNAFGVAVFLPDDGGVRLAQGDDRGKLRGGGRGGGQVYGVAHPEVGERLHGDFADGRGIRIADDGDDVFVCQVGNAADAFGVARGNGQHGNVLDQVHAVCDIFAHRLDLF